MNTTQVRTDDGDEETTPCGGVTDLCEQLDEGTRNPDDLSLIYDVLSNYRRRQMLHLLGAESDNSATIPDLASTIAAREMDVDDPDTVSYDERKSVQSTIYQHHAPKMADAGLVEFDKRTSRLELADRATRLGLARDDADVDGSAGDDRKWMSSDAAAVTGVLAVAVSVAATATVVDSLTAFVVLATSIVTGVITWNRSDQ
ncbi:MAG: DUF7344 domain-containing protein [Methanobacteriota archaeon]